MIRPTRPESAAAARDVRPALAVLPLANRGGALDDRHFADGVRDELRTNLSRIPGLTMMSLGVVEEYREAPSRHSIDIPSLSGCGALRFWECAVRG